MKERNKQGQTNKQGKATQHIHVHVGVPWIHPSLGGSASRAPEHQTRNLVIEGVSPVQGSSNVPISSAICLVISDLQMLVDV